MAKRVPFRGCTIVFHRRCQYKEVKSIILESSENDAVNTTASTVAMKRGPYVKLSQRARCLLFAKNFLSENFIPQKFLAKIIMVATYILYVYAIESNVSNTTKLFGTV